MGNTKIWFEHFYFFNFNIQDEVKNVQFFHPLKDLNETNYLVYDSTLLSDI